MWVFGVILIVMRFVRGFYEVVVRRDCNIFLLIFEKCFFFGSEVIMDDWGVYENFE